MKKKKCLSVGNILVLKLFYRNNKIDNFDNFNKYEKCEINFEFKKQTDQEFITQNLRHGKGNCILK